MAHKFSCQCRKCKEKRSEGRRKAAAQRKRAGTKISRRVRIQSPEGAPPAEERYDPGNVYGREGGAFGVPYNAQREARLDREMGPMLAPDGTPVRGGRQGGPGHSEYELLFRKILSTLRDLDRERFSLSSERDREWIATELYRAIGSHFGR